MDDIYIDHELNIEINKHINLVTELDVNFRKENYGDSILNLHDSLSKLIENELFLAKFVTNQVINHPKIFIIRFIFEFLHLFFVDCTHNYFEINKNFNY